MNTLVGDYKIPEFDQGKIQTRDGFRSEQYLNDKLCTLDYQNLDNLKYIDPKEIEKVVFKINSLSEENICGKEVVIGIGTGGTISMKKNEKTGLLEPDMDFDNILSQASSKLKEDYMFIGVDAIRIDSSQMIPEYIADISITIAYISENINKKISGFIVLHGTDTMAQSASRTAIQLGSGFSNNIVYTGAQKPMSFKRNDAGDNIINSFHTITAACNNNINEIIISFGRRAMLAVGTVKSSGSHSDAFSSPMHDYIMNHGELEEPGDIILPKWLRHKNAAVIFDPRITREASKTIFIPADMYNEPREKFIEIMDKKPTLVVLETYGANTASEQIVQAVSIACKNLSIPGFTISSVDELPGTATYTSSDMLIKAGLAPMNMLYHTAQAKADRINASSLLSDPSFIKQQMTTSYVNEIPHKK